MSHGSVTESKLVFSNPAIPGFTVSFVRCGLVVTVRWNDSLVGDGSYANISCAAARRLFTKLEAEGFNA